MIYPSADKLEEQIKSRYTLVILAAKRAKQLKEGAPKLIETNSTNPLTIALEEIAAGKLFAKVASHDEIPARATEPELEAVPGIESAQEEAAELVAEAPSAADEAARIAELLKVPGTDEDEEASESEEAEDEPDADVDAIADEIEDAEPAAEEDILPGQVEE